jgi:hypothetical protein
MPTDGIWRAVARVANVIGINVALAALEGRGCQQASHGPRGFERVRYDRCPSGRRDAPGSPPDGLRRQPEEVLRE